MKFYTIFDCKPFHDSPKVTITFTIPVFIEIVDEKALIEDVYEGMMVVKILEVMPF